MSSTRSSFSGFPDDFFSFYRSLKKNNNRDWFNANKDRYKESVVQPMSAFIAAMAPGLAKIREFIVDNPAEWSRIRNAKAVKERGGIKGDGLVRPPRGFDPEHKHIEDLKRKSFFLMTQAKPDLMKSPELVKSVTKAFKAATGLNRFVTEALGLRF